MQVLEALSCVDDWPEEIVAEQLARREGHALVIQAFEDGLRIIFGGIERDPNDFEAVQEHLGELPQSRNIPESSRHLLAGVLLEFVNPVLARDVELQVCLESGSPRIRVLAENDPVSRQPIAL